jgi:hypothetical protein
VEVCEVDIVPAVAEKVAVVAEAATVTEVGTERLVLLLLSETTAPLEGAALERVTVQVAAAPELREVELHTREERDPGAVKEMRAVFEALL